MYLYIVFDIVFVVLWLTSTGRVILYSVVFRYRANLLLVILATMTLFFGYSVFLELLSRNILFASSNGTNAESSTTMVSHMFLPVQYFSFFFISNFWELKYVVIWV